MKVNLFTRLLHLTVPLGGIAMYLGLSNEGTRKELALRIELFLNNHNTDSTKLVLKMLEEN